MSGVASGRAAAAPRLRVVAPTPADGRTTPGPVRRALAALDSAGTAEQVLRSVPTAVDLLGLDRVLVVATATVTAEPHLVDRAPACDRGALAALLTHVSGGTQEPDLVIDRRRCAAVAALLDDHGGVPGFVLVPVVSDGAVMALLYGDLARRGNVPDTLHTDRLATFAVAAGHVHAAAALRETLGRVTAARGTPPAPAPSGSPVATRSAPLSPREVEVLWLMSAGRTNAQVGRELRITEGTVKCHVKNVFRKLGAANRAEAVARWLGVDRPARAPVPLHRPPLSPVAGSGARWN